MSDREVTTEGERPVAESEVEETAQSELETKMWSVVCFNKQIAGGLTYDEAVRALEAEKGNKSSGLCIVTDAAAARIRKPENNVL